MHVSCTANIYNRITDNNLVHYSGHSKTHWSAWAVRPIVKYNLKSDTNMKLDQMYDCNLNKKYICSVHLMNAL